MKNIQIDLQNEIEKMKYRIKRISVEKEILTKEAETLDSMIWEFEKIVDGLKDGEYELPPTLVQPAVYSK